MYIYSLLKVYLPVWDRQIPDPEPKSADKSTPVHTWCVLLLEVVVLLLPVIFHFRFKLISLILVPIVVLSMTSHTDELVTVELQPFKHQVSGSHIILEINDSSICKPYSEREVNFYTHLPCGLNRFTPQCLGIVNVRCNRYKDGIRFHGDIPKTIIEKTTSLTYVVYSRRDNNSRFTKSQEKDWNECTERYLRSCSDNSPQKFLILGNLLMTYERPCVIDIKLGKQQRGRYHTEANRQKHEDRCACSTSSTLGFRINGSQVYKMDQDTFIRHDKFHGRKLDVNGVEKELHFFFHNGILLKIDVIQTIVEKLKSLQYVLTNQRTFHLYACSLLLLYDNQVSNSSLNNENVTKIKNMSSGEGSGFPLTSEKPFTNKILENKTVCSRDIKADVKLIDFAHAFQREFSNGKTEENDLDLINGLQNLVQILENLG